MINSINVRFTEDNGAQRETMNKSIKITSANNIENVTEKTAINEIIQHQLLNFKIANRPQQTMMTNSGACIAEEKKETQKSINKRKSYPKIDKMSFKKFKIDTTNELDMNRHGDSAVGFPTENVETKKINDKPQPKIPDTEEVHENQQTLLKSDSNNPTNKYQFEIPKMSNENRNNNTQQSNVNSTQKIMHQNVCFKTTPENFTARKLGKQSREHHHDWGPKIKMNTFIDVLKKILGWNIIDKQQKTRNNEKLDKRNH